MKTEMKKNKMFLALAVVAALAMVSVAGAALLSDDADAAIYNNPMGTGVNSTTVIEDATELDAKFYVNLGSGQTYGVQFIKVQAGVVVNGTITIGTAKDSSGAEYKEYAKVTLTGVQDTVFTLMMVPDAVDGWVGIIMVGDEATVDYAGATPDKIVTNYKQAQGTVEVNEGMAVGGAIRPDSPAMTAAAWNTAATTAPFDLNAVYAAATDDGAIAQYSGTLKAGDSVVDMAYVYGLALGYDGTKATVFNDVKSDDDQLPKNKVADDQNPGQFLYPSAIKKADRNVTFTSGAFSAGYSSADAWKQGFSVNSLFLVVEEAATVTVGDNLPTTAASVVVTNADLQTTDKLVLVSSAGVVIDGDTSTAGQATFANVKLNEQYTIVGSINALAYYSTLTVTGSGGAYQVVFGTNVANGVIANADISFASDVATYTTAYSSTALAIDLTAGEVITGSDLGVRTINITDGNEAIFVLRATTNAQMVFVGTASAPTANAVTDKSTATVAGTATVTSVTNTLSAVQETGDTTEYTVTIRGNVVVQYTGANASGIFKTTPNATPVDYNVNFEGTGMLTYGIAPVPVANSPLTSSAALKTNAAYYYVNVGPTASPTSTTFYYTTLNNALTNSNDITIIGDLVILEDTTLAGANGEAATITIAGSLTIGQVADPTATPPVEAKTPIVTIPGTTDLVKQDSTKVYAVVNGQAVYDTNPSADNAPTSDVLMEGDKFIYTDLATALDISVSGQTLVLRKVDANSTPVNLSNLTRDATLKEGVTLEDTKTNQLAVDEGVILTVNGTLVSIGTMMINGTIVINGTATFNDAAHAVFGQKGAIDIKSTGTLNVDEASDILGTIANGSVTVDGANTLSITGNSEVSASVMSITGTATIEDGSTLRVYKTLTVGAKPTLSTSTSNNAVINGKITLEATAIAYVYGNLSMTGKFANQTVVNTVYNIGTNPYVTLYADNAAPPAQSLPMLYEDQLLDIAITDWNTERIAERGAYLSGNPNTPIGSTDVNNIVWTNLYAEYTVKQYAVTFSYLQGMTWIVNGVKIDDNDSTKMFDYGTVLDVKAAVQPGYEGSPVIKVNGANYTSFTVTGPEAAVFTAEGVQQATSGGDDGGDDGLSLIEILLIIIVIIIAVIALIVAIRLLRS